MIHRIRLSDLQIDRSPEALEENRKRNTELLEQYNRAHEDMVKLCKEKGWEVPVLIC